jgi:hypothetical protein
LTKYAFAMVHLFFLMSRSSVTQAGSCLSQLIFAV